MIQKCCILTARIIAGSKIFIGNQSTPFAIAEGMKHNRILETDITIPNCQPQSWNGMAYMLRNDLDKARALINYAVS